MTLINVYSYGLFKVSSCIMYSVVKLRYLVFLNIIFIDIFAHIYVLVELKNMHFYLRLVKYAKI